MALIEGQLGPRLQSQGTYGNVRLGYETELIATPSHGDYFEAASRGRLFFAANPSAVTFGVGLSATIATFALYNPLGSGVWAILAHAGFAFSAAPAGAVVLWLVGTTSRNATAPTGVTELTVYGNPLGRGAGVCKAYSAATLPAAPVIFRPLTSIVAASSITPPPVDVDLKGSLIVHPGTLVAFQASAAASGFCSMSWEEMPIPPGM